MITIEELLKNSNLPGPRSNPTLLYRFSEQANRQEIQKCLSCERTELINCPEEFVVCCGIVGKCVIQKENIPQMLKEIRKYASHSGWRIREAIVMGIQQS